MSDPILGLIMLGLIVAAIMMGFPTAFTLMGLGMLFGFVAFFDPAFPWWDNKVFTLMVQRTYGVMVNDTLLSVPLFVFMGYVIERAALVDKMFFSVQLAFRRLPASLAVTTLLVCAFWGIASGIVGAVVVLMGVIALRPMLSAGYDTRLAAGVITAGGTLGILIPPSVMLIVYAAVAGQSIVKLYAAAMLPGFFLTALYLIYVIGWAIINPKVAPKLSPEKYRMDVPPWLQALEGAGPERRVVPGLVAATFSPARRARAQAASGQPVGFGLVFKNYLAAFIPLVLSALLLATAWWYVTIYSAASAEPVSVPMEMQAPADAPGQSPGGLQEPPSGGLQEPPAEGGLTEPPPEPLADGVQEPARAAPVQEPRPSGPELMTGEVGPAGGGTAGKVPESFYAWFWSISALMALTLVFYYWRMDGEQLEILKLLSEAVIPLGILTFIVLAVILFGITTATESAAVGAMGALYLAAMGKYAKRALWASLAGAIIGALLAYMMGAKFVPILVSSCLAGLMAGTLVPWIWDLAVTRSLLQNLRESTYLTAKTTAMVCWLFVGSALFSAVFALHGGQGIIERWVLGMNLSPLQFMLLAQAIIFFLGWPLEWTEIIVIFVPIFLPMLAHFQIDPILFGAMVAVNLQAAFLSPPVAMSAFYLKGVAPKHVTLNQIFAGMMPYMFIVIVCLAVMYVWPGMALWLPEFLYGK